MSKKDAAYNGGAAVEALLEAPSLSVVRSQGFAEGTEPGEVKRMLAALPSLIEHAPRAASPRAILALFNEQLRGAGIAVGLLEEVCITNRDLAARLGLRPANRDERAQLRALNASSVAPEIRLGTRLGISISKGNRRVGILWIGADRSGLQMAFARIAAARLGEAIDHANLRDALQRADVRVRVAIEREHIAKDLCNSVGQTLFGIGLQLQSLLLLTSDSSQTDSLLGLRELARKGLEDARNALHALSCLQVHEHGLVRSLESLVAEFTRSTGVWAELRVAKNLRTKSEAVSGVIYHIAHEALVYLERPSRATGVVLVLTTKDNNIAFDIRDDGIGLRQRDQHDWRSSAHFGLRSIQTAVEEVGGSFTMSRAPVRGFQLRVRIPDPAPAGHAD